MLSLFVMVTLSQCEVFAEFDPTEVIGADVEDDVDDNNDGGNDDGNNDGNNDGGNGGGGNGGGGNGGGNGNGDGFGSEESVDDPQQTGLSCADLYSRNYAVDLIDIVDIPTDLPEQYDLSELMPPVRSQGQQGSCVAWAVVYYLKSYQEKVEFGYEYESFADVMSPAFAYNQIANGNCGGGSPIAQNLEILKTQGTVSWEEFPYSDDICTIQPTTEQLELAEKNKIEDYFIVGIPDNHPDPDYTQINLMKTLLTEDNPLVMGFSIKEVDFSFLNNEDNDYIGLTFTPDPNDPCGHGVLIVGYDDELQAFKFVNSWGTFWGNEGYAWLSYDFFKPLSDPNHQNGVGSVYIAYDVIEN